MHRRFQGARVARAEVGDRRFDVVVAEGFRLRLLGLMRLEEAEIRPLLFRRCRSLHTFWMRAPIDVVWLGLDERSGQAGVLSVDPAVPPGRTARAPGGLDRDERRRVGALELAAGDAAKLGLTEESRIKLHPPAG